MHRALIILFAFLLIAITATAQSPGGVAGAAFWVRADAGVTGTTSVSQWNDQSGNNNHAVQGTAGQQPSPVTNALNFNPAIDFSDANDIMSLTTPPANLNATILAVDIPRVNTNYRTMFRGTLLVSR